LLRAIHIVESNTHCCKCDTLLRDSDMSYMQLQSSTCIVSLRSLLRNVYNMHLDLENTFRNTH